MGISAAIAVGAIGGAVAVKSMAPKVETPKEVAPPEEVKPEEVDQSARAAQDKQRRAAQAAAGRQSTLLTGPQGIQDAADPAASKASTLLGG